MLHHKGTQTIYTPRLILRRFTVNDANDMFQNWANDERVTRYLSWAPHKSVEETTTLLQEWCAAYDNLFTYNWVMEYDGRAIGCISVVRSHDNRQWAELGYCMGYAYWNKGFMTEAATAAIDYLFREVGYHRIEIAHAVKNPASGAVARKCGLSYEGTRRESFKTHDGEYWDVAYHSILFDEWNQKTNGYGQRRSKSVC